VKILYQFFQIGYGWIVIRECARLLSPMPILFFFGGQYQEEKWCYLMKWEGLCVIKLLLLLQYVY